MLGVSTHEVNSFALTPFNALTRVKLNEQNFGLIMAADPSRDSWLTSLIRLDRISGIDAGCAVEIGCPLYLELSFGMLGELVNLQGLKTHVVKRQMDKIMTPSDVHSPLPPLNHRQQQPPEQLPWGPTRQAIALRGNNNSCAFTPAVQACAEPCCTTDDLALRTVPHALPYNKCSQTIQ